MAGRANRLRLNATISRWIQRAFLGLSTTKKATLVERASHGQFSRSTIRLAVRSYIRLDLSSADPSDFIELEDAKFVPRQDALEVLLDLVRNQNSAVRPHAFVLAESGMGKTSLLLNAAWFIEKKAKLKVQLVHLGARDADRVIAACTDKSNRVLLLDGLDEDSKAYGQVEKRLRQLVVVATEYRAVIVSCRTAFLYSVPQIPRLVELEKKSNNPETVSNYVEFRHFHIMPLSSNQIDDLLTDRFGRLDVAKRKHAREILSAAFRGKQKAIVLNPDLSPATPALPLATLADILSTIATGELQDRRRMPDEFDFSNRHFTDRIEISGHRFTKTLRLDNSVFDRGLCITECSFAERLSATGISCNGGNADFADCEFSGRVTLRPIKTSLLSLRSGVFSAGFEIVVDQYTAMELDLRHSRIRGDAAIKSAHYRQTNAQPPARMQELILHDSVLEKEASLELGCLRLKQLHLNDLLVQDKASLYCVSVHAETLWMENLRITDKANLSFYDVDFSGARMIGTNVEKFTFAKINWPMFNERACLHDEIMLRKELGESRAALNKASMLELRDGVAENYRQLVLNHEARRNYELAENFHVGEMEMARLAAIASSGWGLYLGRLNSFGLYRVLSVYGTSYHRATVVLCGLLLLFAALFLFNGIQVKESKRVVDYELCWCLPSSQLEWAAFAHDYGASVGMTLSIATLQKERPLEPLGTGGSLLASALLLTASAQAALLLFALRRRFRRASI